MTSSERAVLWNKNNYNRFRIYNVLNQCKIRAKKKDLEYDLDSAWYREKSKGMCELTGLPFSLEPPRERGKHNPLAPSIDRINCSKGYTKDNCRVVLWAVNRALGEDGIGILYYWCKAFIDKIKEYK